MSTSVTIMHPEKFNHCYATLNGANYHYVDEGTGPTTVLLLHGFPDLWYGWRHQIVFLKGQGYRVLAPDLRGYGQTDDSDNLSDYGLKRVAQDMVALLDTLRIGQAVVIGHDWGGPLAWRICMYYPERVMAVGSVCSAYTPPDRQFRDTATIAKLAPNLKYHLYFDSDQAVRDLDSNIELFLRYVLRGVNDRLPGTLDEQWMKNADKLSASQLITEAELDYYTSELKRKGFRGPLSWYRTRRVNFEDEKAAGLGIRIEHPALMITAANDSALPPSMAAKMPKFFRDLTIRNVDNCAHWLMVEHPDKCNAILLEFLRKVEAEASAYRGKL